MGAYRPRNVVKHAVLNKNVFAVEILGAAIDNMLWVQYVKLNYFVTVVIRSKDLVSEGAAFGGKAVATRHFHHMAFEFIYRGHVPHRKVFGVGYLEHGIASKISVVGAADERDVPVLISYGSRIHCVLAADADHIAGKVALQGNAAEVKSGVIKNFKPAAKDVTAGSSLYGDGI